MKSNLTLNLIIGFLVFYQINGLPTRNETKSKTNYEQNPQLFEGDMIFHPQPRGVLRRGDETVWPNGIVPYEFESGFRYSTEQFIVSTMRKMEDLLAVNNVKCIQFRPRTASDSIYITIINGNGCYSYVGRNDVNSEHTVSLQDPGCIYRGTIMHEFLHALGFYHEQSRPDRDDYIRINWENIGSGFEHNFDKYSNSLVDTLNTPYDYSSVMHYGSTAFSQNGEPTIEPLEWDVDIGQRETLSEIDIEEVHLVYKCAATTTTTRRTSTTRTTPTTRRTSTIRTTTTTRRTSTPRTTPTTRRTSTIRTTPTTPTTRRTSTIRTTPTTRRTSTIRTTPTTRRTSTIRSTFTTRTIPTIIIWFGNWAYGCEFRGNDLTNVRLPCKDCRSRCAATLGCTHYTWTSLNNGTCWMKSGIVSKDSAFPTGDLSTVCGLVGSNSGSIINWNGNWAFGCDFSGNDLENVRVASDDCSKTCKQTSKCTHFTWSRYNGGTCSMKRGSVTEVDAFPTGDLSMICGFFNSTSAPTINWNGKWAYGCDFKGNDIQSVRVSNDDCARTCKQTSKCTHFVYKSYNGGTCTMKRGPVTEDNAILTGDLSMICGFIQ